MTRRRTWTGVVTGLAFPGATASPRVTVTIQLAEGFGQIVFLSRRNVECIDIGARIEATGAVIEVKGVPTIYDPEFTVSYATD